MSKWKITFLWLSVTQLLHKGENKGKNLLPDIPLLTRLTTRNQKCFCNLGSGSWLARANDTRMHYAVIHCPRQWTIGPTVQPADIPLPPAFRLRVYPVARKLSYYTFLIRQRVGGWVDLGTYWDSVGKWSPHQQQRVVGCTVLINSCNQCL